MKHWPGISLRPCSVLVVLSLAFVLSPQTFASRPRELPRLPAWWNAPRVDRLCNVKLRRLVDDQGPPIHFAGPIPHLVDSRSLSANAKFDVHSKLNLELQFFPKELLERLSRWAVIEEGNFRSILSVSGVPFAFHSAASGHSYADLGMQALVLSSWVPSSRVYEARSLLLRFIHFVDDYFDLLVLQTPISTEDLNRGGVHLLSHFDSRLFTVFNRLQQHLLYIFPSYRSDYVLDGVKKTAQASVMFAENVPSTQRRLIQRLYQYSRVSLVSPYKALAALYAQLPPLYIAYTSKVLLTAFDMPFEAYWKKGFDVGDVLPLSLVSELLYLPALVKQDQGRELRSGETSQKETLSLEQIHSALLLVFDFIEKLPIEERRFILRNYPLFRSAFSNVLRAKSLSSAYDEFEKRPAIRDLIQWESVYAESLFSLRLGVPVEVKVPTHLTFEPQH